MSLGGITAGYFSRRNKRLPVVDQVWGRGMAVPFVPIGAHLSPVRGLATNGGGSLEYESELHLSYS
jgi:hypothetical protein